MSHITGRCSSCFDPLGDEHIACELCTMMNSNYSDDVDARLDRIMENITKMILERGLTWTLPKK